MEGVGWKVLWVERGGEGEAVGGFISGGDGGGRRGVRVGVCCGDGGLEDWECARFASGLVFFPWMNGEDDAGLDILYWVYRSTGSCLPGPFSVY